MAVNKTINVKINNNFEETAEDLNDLNDGLKQTAEASEEASESTAEMSSNLASMNPAIAGVVGAFGKLKTGLASVGRAFFTLRGAIIASGIGALALAIISVTQAFKGSEEGQNKFSKLMYGIGVIMDNILDLLADVGEMLISAFENPIETIKNFGKAIIDNIITRFEGMLELIPAIGSAISELFSGNFSLAGRIASNAMGKVVFGIENVVEKTEKAIEVSAEFLAQQKEELRIAGEISDARAKADILERKLLVERSKLQTDISKLKLKSREEDTVSAEERKKALLDAQALEDSLLKKELEVAQLRFDSIRRENTLARSTKEAKDAEAQAEADLFNIISRRTDAQRSTQRELNRVNKEIARIAKERQKVETAALEYGVEFTKQMTNEEIIVLTEAAKAKYDLIVVLTEAAKAKYDLIVKEGQERIKLQDAQDKLRIDLMDDGFDKELAKLVAESEARLAIAKDDKELQLEIEADFQKKLKELEEKTSKEIKDQKIKDAKATAEAEKKIQDAQISNVEAGISLIKSLAGENKKVQAAALIAENAVGIAKTIINTQTANAAALATPQAILTSGASAAPVIAANNIAAGISIAASVAATAQGLSALGTGGNPDGGGNLPAGGGGGVQAPSFNVVGDSGVNQLAELQQQPTQAYVVSGEVTTAQALDRNRVQNATL
jgi:hypothetical protein